MSPDRPDIRKRSARTPKLNPGKTLALRAGSGVLLRADGATV
jgi:hypothetical protein